MTFQNQQPDGRCDEVEDGVEELYAQRCLLKCYLYSNNLDKLTNNKGMTSKMRCIHLVECYTISAIPTPTPEMLIVMLENNSTQILCSSTYKQPIDNIVFKFPALWKYS